MTKARQAEMIALLRSLTSSAQAVVEHYKKDEYYYIDTGQLELDASDAAEFLEWLDTHNAP